MEQFHGIPYLQEIVIILVAAGILVPLFIRFRISPVFGYLLIGFLVGPYCFGALAHPKDHLMHFLTIKSPDNVELLAEFGVVFLMFMIGLELSPQRLWGM